MRRRYDPLKRCLDICIAAIALVILLPALVVTWALVGVFLGSPALFRQTRAGLNGQPFTMIKFRTMASSFHVHAPLPADEAGLTQLGRFLRLASIDELPQLWNVLVGSMSLVGPRPLLMEYLPLYTPAQARRHQVRPGLTGWAQINGRNSLDWSDRFAMDVWYVNNRSLRLDLSILWRSIWIVLLRRGARPLDSAPPFCGLDRAIDERAQQPAPDENRSFRG